MRINDPRDVLLAPVISEKSYGLLDENKYTFIVAPDANKTQIKIAVEQVFGVRVTAVNTSNREGKRIRTQPLPSSAWQLAQEKSQGPAR